MTGIERDEVLWRTVHSHIDARAWEDAVALLNNEVATTPDADWVKTLWVRLARAVAPAVYSDALSVERPAVVPPADLDLTVDRLVAEPPTRFSLQSLAWLSVAVRESRRPVRPHPRCCREGCRRHQGRGHVGRALRSRLRHALELGDSDRALTLGAGSGFDDAVSADRWKLASMQVRTLAIVRAHQSIEHGERTIADIPTGARGSLVWSHVASNLVYSLAVVGRWQEAEELAHEILAVVGEVPPRGSLC